MRLRTLHGTQKGFCLPCSQMFLPLHSLHWPLILECGQICEPAMIVRKGCSTTNLRIACNKGLACRGYTLQRKTTRLGPLS